MFEPIEMGGTVTWNRISGTNVFYTKKNGVVEVLLGGVSGLTPNAHNTVGTLPEGYRPKVYAQYFICGDGGNGFTLVGIDNRTGVIDASPKGTSTYAYGSTTYLVDD